MEALLFLVPQQYYVSIGRPDSHAVLSGMYFRRTLLELLLLYVSKDL